ncbi:hypothetical protein WDV93_00920 [Pantoea ananatis]
MTGARFWQKIWCENYPKAVWVWQSTNAGDSYQAKFSLIPMVVGTLSGQYGSAVCHAAGAGRRDVYRVVYGTGPASLG